MCFMCFMKVRPICFKYILKRNIYLLKFVNSYDLHPIFLFSRTKLTNSSLCKYLEVGFRVGTNSHLTNSNLFFFFFFDTKNQTKSPLSSSILFFLRNHLPLFFIPNLFLIFVNLQAYPSTKSVATVLSQQNSKSNHLQQSLVSI